LSSLFVLRRFRVGYPAACVAALLFTFLPYHFTRLVHWHHLHLAAYYQVPLVVLVTLRVYLGQLPLVHLHPAPGGSRWHPLSGRTLGAMLVCLLTGLSGGYYAFFACVLLGAAGAASAWCHRRLAPLAAALALAAVIVGAVAVGLAPTTAYRREHGVNPLAEDTRRYPAESEIYGLKLAQALLPIQGHRLKWAADLRAGYDAPPMPLINENGTAALGAAGALGLLGLLARLVLRRPDPRRRIKPLDALAALTVVSILLGTVGGFGSLHALLVSPTIRCYNRISVYLGFFALFAGALALDRVVRRLATTRARAAACWGVLAAVLALGVLDQTSAAYTPDHGRLRREHQVMVDFIQRVEALVPPGGCVYQLPHIPFPCHPVLHEMHDYEHFRPYLYSHTVRWSYGAMKGRPAGAWLDHISAQPPERLVRALALCDFAGVYVDRGGYADRGAATEAELTRLLGPAAAVSADGRRSFFRLGAYAEALRRNHSDEEWGQLRRLALRVPLGVTWGAGFYGTERSGDETWNWCAGEGELTVTNWSSAPRMLTLSMTCVLPAGRPYRLQVDGDLLSLDCPVDGKGRKIEKTVEVPPGAHAIRFRCDAPPLAAPDARKLVFRVQNFSWRED
jgi:phosphoglycerol transferase